MTYDMSIVSQTHGLFQAVRLGESVCLSMYLFCINSLLVISSPLCLPFVSISLAIYTRVIQIIEDISSILTANLSDMVIIRYPQRLVVPNIYGCF